MASLKTLKTRIKSVKSTQKITKAMKMVAAAKLRRATEAAHAARPYAERMATMLSALAANITAPETASRLLVGTGSDKTHLLVVATGDRGLCGAFNTSIVRATRRKIAALKAEGKAVKLFCVGRKGYEQLQFEFGPLIIGRMSEIGKKKVVYADALRVAEEISKRFHNGEFDVATIIYNHFKSAIAQEVTLQQLIPLSVEGQGSSVEEKNAPRPSPLAPYEFEPEEDEILAALLPKNMAVQLFKALLENAASEQGSRMTAMDNATRNAGEMIGKLSLVYNRTRQANITRELIEIISGAEAL